MIVRERHLVFASWPVDAAQLRPLVHPRLELDTFDGQPWITVEMLQASLVRLAWLPPVPVIAVPQVNVRTYVRFAGERGIYFLSLDYPGLFGSTLARAFSRLPLRESAVTVALEGDNYHAESHRVVQHPDPPRFAFSGRLQSGPRSAPSDGIDAFLVNQTTLFAGSSGPLHRGVVDHRPHALQAIDGTVEINTLVSSLGLALPSEPPRLQYSPGDDSRAWPFVQVA
jgi:uncharacterized protein YqjF (DUF2071 family)